MGWRVLQGGCVLRGLAGAPGGRCFGAVGEVVRPGRSCLLLLPAKDLGAPKLRRPLLPAERIVAEVRCDPATAPADLTPKQVGCCLEVP